MVTHGAAAVDVGGIEGVRILVLKCRLVGTEDGRCGQTQEIVDLG